MTILRAIIVAMLLPAFADAALADFRLCNNTRSRVGVALGYKDKEGWATEGWWNVTPGNCVTLLSGALVGRYYYIYAVDYDRGGEWSGQAFMCTREKEFTIRNTDNCLARGMDRTGFFEVDTGEQRTWTVQLTDNAESVPDRPLLPFPQRTPPGARQPVPPPGMPTVPPQPPTAPPAAAPPTAAPPPAGAPPQ